MQTDLVRCWHRGRLGHAQGRQRHKRRCDGGDEQRRIPHDPPVLTWVRAQIRCSAPARPATRLANYTRSYRTSWPKIYVRAAERSRSLLFAPPARLVVPFRALNFETVALGSICPVRGSLSTSPTGSPSGSDRMGGQDPPHRSRMRRCSVRGRWSAGPWQGREYGDQRQPERVQMHLLRAGQSDAVTAMLASCQNALD